jgi:hypothetical protein
VDFRQTTRQDSWGPFYRVYLEFLVRRVVHDLGNSISGINSLSDYHLRTGISDPGLQETLTLIRESAELSRELLVAGGDILQPAEPDEELVGVHSLIEEVGKFVSLLLPKSVQLETIGAEENDAVISVLRGDFLRKILALVAMDMNEGRVTHGAIRLGWIRDEQHARIHYRSTLPAGSALREQAPALLANLSRSVEINACVDTEAFILTMTFPLVELVEE